MKSIKKLAAISFGVALSMTTLTGCSTNGLALFNAFQKAQNITAMESNTDMSLKVSAANLSAEEQKGLQNVLPMLNNMKLNFATKLNQSSDKTNSKMQCDIKAQVGAFPLDMSLWVNTNLSGANPGIQEVFKIPAIAAAALPQEAAGKEYMVMDTSKMPAVNGQTPIDYNKVAQFTKDMQPKLKDFMQNIADRFNPDFNMVTKLGKNTITVGGVEQQVDIYQVKLDDQTLKGLIRYTESNLAANKDAVKFVRDYILASLELSTSEGDQLKAAQQEVNIVFDSFLNQTPEVVNSINSALDTLDKVKILGDKGLVINYAVNSDGYIVNEAGSVQFVLDMTNINKVFEDSKSNVKETNTPTGVYTLDLSFNTDIININGNVVVDMPELNSNNSFDYFDLIKAGQTSTTVAKN